MNFNRNSYISIQENAFENVVCEMVAILSRPQCVKDIINKQKSKVEFTTYFLNNGRHAEDAKYIADKFNEYFTEIGPNLASGINVSNKAPFNTYLSSPCTSSFQCRVGMSVPNCHKDICNDHGDLVPKGPINNTGPENGWTPTRRQAIIWANDG